MLCRVGVFVLFFFPGLQKIQDPSSFIPMIEAGFGLSGTVAVIVAWLVILAEVFGGLAILLGKLVPRSLYKFSVFGLLLVSLGILYLQTADPAMMMMWSTTLLIILVLVGLLFSAPLCSMGITGYKCTQSACKATEKDVIVIDA
ncbi:DoxX family protein [Candidatus Peribacteria bacterium]|nr:DoxX family protein [Candidatus Peribacteria bacterium]